MDCIHLRHHQELERYKSPLPRACAARHQGAVIQGHHTIYGDSHPIPISSSILSVQKRVISWGMTGDYLKLNLVVTLTALLVQIYISPGTQ